MKEIDSKLYSFESLFIDNLLRLPVGDIYQIAELSVVRDGEIPEHTQICDEITYAISGKAKVYSGDECASLSGGQLHYIKKGRPHKIVAEPDSNFRYICVGFVPNEKNEMLRAYTDEMKNKNSCIINDDGNIRVLCELLINETYKKDSQSNNMISLCLMQILIHLYRLSSNEQKSFFVGEKGSGFTVYHILRYIDREYLNITSVKDISNKMSYSEYYISHLFKEKIGISIKEYITDKKMKNAAVLLTTSNLTIGEVSEHLNFSTEHTFRQAFKKHHGVSPREYREINRKF